MVVSERSAKRQKHSDETEASLLDDKDTRRDGILAKEAEALASLREDAACATIVDCEKSGRISQSPDDKASSFEEIQGLYKVTLSPSLLKAFSEIHEEIKGQVGIQQMVPWAGVGEDMTRLRGFGFLDQERHKRLNDCGIRLYARELDIDGTETEICKDELANNKACSVLADEWKDKAESAAQSLVDMFPPMIPSLSVKELIALQPNLHNGAAHLAAHVDFPRHEGFGKVICTVAVRGSATILLFERNCNDGNGFQRVWRFRLHEGDCYVLSGNARNRVLHAVLADDEEDGFRESLNLRFGLHSAEEAEKDITQYWSLDDI